MIILFMISFGAANIMMFTGFIRMASVYSNAHFDNSKAAHKARKRRLRKHWLIVLVLFAIAIYAALNLS